MVGRRFLQMAALAGLFLSVGCARWCHDHYPASACCPAPQPCCCTPCTPTTGYAAPGWNNPAPAPCPCTPGH